MHITGNVVLQLLCVVRDQRSLLLGTLSALTITHFNLTARKDFRVAHVLTDENLSIIVLSFVIEANEAELVAEDFGEYL